jgi:hypothetical protein
MQMFVFYREPRSDLPSTQNSALIGPRIASAHAAQALALRVRGVSDKPLIFLMIGHFV